MKGFAMVGTNDLESSAKFYDTLLDIIGLKTIYSDDKCIGYAQRDEDDVEFYVTKPANGDAATYGNGTQISFLTDSRVKVDNFHKVGIDIGGKNEGLPGVRPVDGDSYYAYVRDLDGNKICAYTNSEI
jgi:catechol 2,3-dioxygenase-like lactoylglutathione lyase family enzyme